MTGPRGDLLPETMPLGKKIERPKPEPFPLKPAPGHERDWSVVIGPDGKWETHIEGNDQINPPEPA